MGLNPGCLLKSFLLYPKKYILKQKGYRFLTFLLIIFFYCAVVRFLFHKNKNSLPHDLYTMASELRQSPAATYFDLTTFSQEVSSSNHVKKSSLDLEHKLLRYSKIHFRTRVENEAFYIGFGYLSSDLFHFF